MIIRELKEMLKDFNDEDFVRFVTKQGKVRNLKRIENRTPNGTRVVHIILAGKNGL